MSILNNVFVFVSLSWSRRLNSPVNAEDHEYVVQVYRCTGVLQLPSPVNAEDHEHVGGGNEPPRPGHHQHFADEVPCVPLAKKSYNKTFSKTQIAEKSLTKVKV